MLQGIGTLGGAITVLIAAAIGANTYTKWKQQKVAERLSQQAEKILSATYKVRRQLLIVRNPMVLAFEIEAGQKKLEENGVWDQVADETERRSLEVTQARYNRLNAARPAQNELDECQPLARALFGEDMEKAIETLNNQFWIVQVNIDAYHRDRRGVDQNFRREIESVIWTGYPPDQENKVDSIIEENFKYIEDNCLPALRLQDGKSA